jgi:hypothetical protein
MPPAAAKADIEPILAYYQAMKRSALSLRWCKLKTFQSHLFCRRDGSLIVKAGQHCWPAPCCL